MWTPKVAKTTLWDSISRNTWTDRSIRNMFCMESARSYIEKNEAFDYRHIPCQRAQVLWAVALLDQQPMECYLKRQGLLFQCTRRYNLFSLHCITGPPSWDHVCAHSILSSNHQPVESVDMPKRSWNSNPEHLVDLQENRHQQLAT